MGVPDTVVHNGAFEKHEDRALMLEQDAARADAELEAAQTMGLQPSRQQHEGDGEDDEQAKGLLEKRNVHSTDI